MTNNQAASIVRKYIKGNPDYRYTQVKVTKGTIHFTNLPEWQYASSLCLAATAHEFKDMDRTMTSIIEE